MTEVPTAPSAPSRQERRKAETRRRIVAAAEGLFAEKGYAATSIEDIAATADVAVRTIYLHFSSKAGIVLSYFDSWMDAFIQAVLERPVDEPVVDTIAAALADMAAQGWVERVEDDLNGPHPMVELLRTGPPDVAGHATQRWLAAVSELTADATRRSTGTADPLGPYARAMAFFTFWFAGLGVAGEKIHGGDVPADATALGLMRRITGGV